MNDGASEIVHPDGRVELVAHDAVEQSSLYNPDLAPVRVAERTWSTWDYAALWISMAHCIPTYMMASGLVDAGMSWWQALVTILLGNVIVLAPILLNSHPGTKYGIPFPVFARAAYGTYGANLPALMRALVACGWFGINAWIGGAALQVFFVSLWRGWARLLGHWNGYPGTQWLSFLLFWALNILVIYRGMELVRKVERWAAPFVLVMTAVLVVWAIHAAHGLGPTLEQGRGLHGATFWHVFIPSLTATIGFWSTLSLNMPDFTRFGRSQREQAIGQVVALPTTMTVFAAMGIMITSATVIIYGGAIREPITLVSHFHSRLIVAVATFTIVVATLAVNIAANVVSPANDFANAFPQRIDFKTGGLITGVLGIAFMPWELLANSKRYIDGWLIGYSGALGAIAGVLIADYWLIRKTRLALHDLYMAEGVYRYTNGWNRAAVIATLLGAGVALGGAFWSPMHRIYDWAWFIGFGLAGATYLLLMRGRPPAGV
ncbi:MAG TPA: NCS1 family nucleobase:cation symporter-1 [Kofleriaceae bacterium]|nr:NCS1 family nucleobase:cation symporter-1 [Kofleriaceae bacterium]